MSEGYCYVMPAVAYLLGCAWCVIKFGTTKQLNLFWTNTVLLTLRTMNTSVHGSNYSSRQ